MSKNKPDNRRKVRLGRPPKHGGYSLIVRDEILKDHPYVRQYLQNCRDGLVEDVAGSEERLTEQQRIIIDRYHKQTIDMQAHRGLYREIWSFPKGIG